MALSGKLHSSAVLPARRILPKSGFAYILLLQLATLTLPASLLPSSPITVVFRYDDFSMRSRPNGLEEQILGTFIQQGIPFTIAAVAFVCEGNAYDPSPQKLLPLTTEKIAFLRPAVETGAVEIALHGYAHQTRRLKPHPFDFTLDDKDSTRLSPAGLERMLIRLKEAPGVSFATFSRLADSGIDLGVQRFKNFNSCCKALYIAPFFISRSPRIFYLGAEQAAGLTRRVWLIDILYYLVLLAAGWLLGRLAGRLMVQLRIFRYGMMEYVGKRRLLALIMLILLFLLPGWLLRISYAFLAAGAVIGCSGKMKSGS